MSMFAEDFYEKPAESLDNPLIWHFIYLVL